MIIKPEIILTTSDLSENSEIALQRAALLAREHGARIELLHVQEDCAGEGFSREAESDELCRQLIRSAEEELGRQAEKTFGSGVEFSCQVAAGKDFVIIIRKARMLNADLTVMGAHGSHSIRDLFLGTTPEKVVRKGEGPVLTVKAPPAGPYDCVLVPTDFSEASRQALIVALALAPASRFKLLYAYELWGQGRLTMAGDENEAVSRFHQQALDAAKRRMEEFVQGIDLDPGKVERHFGHGHAASVISSMAEELGADLVAMGTEGRSGLPYILLGSVAEHVLREAHCDVLTVKPPNFRFELP